MTTNRRSGRVLLPGPVLLGFAEFFDRSWGDPRTPRPYPRVAPSMVGGVLLPFPCPHCGEVRSAVVDPKTRKGYWDRQRNYSWCPACNKRYVIDSKGRELEEGLPEGATHAPALVTRGDKTEVIGLPVADGFNMLGAV